MHNSLGMLPNIGSGNFFWECNCIKGFTKFTFLEWKDMLKVSPSKKLQISCHSWVVSWCQNMAGFWSLVNQRGSAPGSGLKPLCTGYGCLMYQLQGDFLCTFYKGVTSKVHSVSFQSLKGNLYAGFWSYRTCIHSQKRQLNPLLIIISDRFGNINF